MKFVDKTGLERFLDNLRTEFVQAGDGGVYHNYVPEFFRSLMRGAIAMWKRKGLDVAEYENMSDEEAVKGFFSWFSEELGAWGSLPDSFARELEGVGAAATRFLDSHSEVTVDDSYSGAFLDALGKMYDSSEMFYNTLSNGAEMGFSAVAPEGDHEVPGMTDYSPLGVLNIMGEDFAVELLKFIGKICNDWSERGGAEGMAESIGGMNELLTGTGDELKVLPAFYSGLYKGANNFCEEYGLDKQFPDEMPREAVNDNIGDIAEKIGYGIAFVTVWGPRSMEALYNLDERVTQLSNYTNMYARSCTRDGGAALGDILDRTPLSPLVESAGAVWDAGFRSYTYKGESRLSVYEVLDRVVADALGTTEVISDEEIDALFANS